MKIRCDCWLLTALCIFCCLDHTVWAAQARPNILWLTCEDISAYGVFLVHPAEAGARTALQQMLAKDSLAGNRVLAAQALGLVADPEAAFLASMAGCATSTSNVRASHHSATKGADLNDARVLYESGKFDAAEQKLEGVLRRDPNNATALHLLGLVEEGRTRRESGRERPWGYYPTIPLQPIYR